MRDSLSRAWLLLSLLLMPLVMLSCARGQSKLDGWCAMQPGMELSYEKDAGPRGEDVFALLYTIIPGQDYAIEHRMPIQGLEGRPSLHLQAKATRILHLAFVLVDSEGQEHECARTLLPGNWRELQFDDFRPPVEDWAQIVTVRFVDRSGGLGGQGPVSLKLIGLPQ